jgi:hypothetical protein
MRRRDWLALGLIVVVTAGLVIFRHFFLEPRIWGTVCRAAAPPLACVPRGWVIYLQRSYLWGGFSLALGLWGFFAPAPFAVPVLAIILGLGGVENYNASWGALGAALGFWAWLRWDSSPSADENSSAAP